MWKDFFKHYNKDKFLKQFIIQYNNKSALCINHNKSVFEKHPSKEKINLTLAVLCQRVVDSGHSKKINNKYYRFIIKIVNPIYFVKNLVKNDCYSVYIYSSLAPK